MRILYLDCTGGVSGDMLLKAVSRLSGMEEKIYSMRDREELSSGKEGSGSGHGRSHKEVRRLILESSFPEAAKQTALRIYGHIAQAEAEVHGEEPETVHFHEVGRDEAVKNALAAGMALEALHPGGVWVSPVYDGRGTVVCSHGEISVPVPAVMALRSRCSYDFRTADVDTEMVTPSGLAMVMGIGAEPADSAAVEKARVVKSAEARGTRDTGRKGLTAYILETE